MAQRDRDTYIHRRGVTPETTSVISSKNKIYAIPSDPDSKTLIQIGVVATFDPSESRTIETVRGIGYGDHVAELVPGVTEPMTFSVTRTAQYLSMIYQVFGYKGGIDGLVRSLRHHKWPFDVVQEVVISRLVSESYTGNMTQNKSTSLTSDVTDAIVTYYEGCWMSDCSVSYAADAALVQENVTIHVTDILANGSAVYDENSQFLFNNAARSRIIGSTSAVTPETTATVPSLGQTL